MINTIIEGLVSLFDSIMCVYFILAFNKSTWRSSIFAIPTIIVLFIVTLVSDHILPGFSTITSIILLIISIAYAFTVCQKHYIRAIISTCFYKILYILLSSLLYMIISMIINDFDKLMQGSDGIGRYLYILIHKISLFAISSFILNIFHTGNIYEIKNGILTLFISIMTIIGMGATMTFIVNPAADQYKYHILIITLAFITINIVVYLLIAQIQDLNKNKYELRLMQEKMKFEEDRHKDASTIWNNIRKVQHDIKQHLTIISCQLNDKKYDECQDYINLLLPSVERMGRIVKSDNEILDYLINTKLCSINDANISISGTIGNLNDIRDIDLVCLIGNILDNAVEAVRKIEDKRIDLIFSNQNSNRIIICKNSIEKSVLNTNKELKSTKNDTCHHGFGHIIIEKIVYDYDGMIEYFEEGNMFGVQVILPIQNNK